MRKFVWLLSSSLLSSAVFAVPATKPPLPFHGEGEYVFLLPETKSFKTFPKFTTTTELDRHYTRLLNALRQRNPADDINSLVANGTMYLVNSVHDPLDPLPPLNNFLYSSYQKTCPVKTLEGSYPDYYVDRNTLEKIEKSKLPKPPGELLRWQGNVQRTAIVEAYLKEARQYGEKWARLMQPLCLKKAGVPHKSTLPPVKATHQVIGNTVYILDETTFRTPHYERIHETLYRERIRTAIRQKNPVTDATEAISRKEAYLLSTAGMSVEERDLILRVCPVKKMEGEDYTNNYLFNAYKLRWNQLMLPVCRNKYATHIPFGKQRLDWLTAKEHWATRPNIGTSYTYTLTTPQRAVEVQVVNGKVKRVSTLPERKPLPLSTGKTVGEWFTMIESALDRPAHRVNVEYHSLYGYPTAIQIQFVDKPMLQYKISHFSSQTN